MKKLLKACAITVLLLLFAPVLTFAVYDVVKFQPRIGEISAIYDAAHQQDKNAPELIRELVNISCNGTCSISVNVARSLLRTLEKHKRLKPLEWHLQSTVWALLLKLHLPEGEIMGLYLSIVFDGHGFGLNNLAVGYYGKPLDQLTEEQAATVVALMASPRYFSKYPERLNARKAMLLSQLGSGSTP